MVDEVVPGDTGNDTAFIDSGVADIASSLGFEVEEPEKAPENGKEPADPKDLDTTPPESKPGGEKVEVQPDDKAATAPVVRQPPKSWAKDKHEVWSKMPVEAQDYYEQREKQFLDGIEMYKGDAGYGKTMRDAMAPYKAVIDAQGIDEPRAVQYLLNAHYRLTQGSTEQRKSAYEQLGRNLGLVAPAEGEEVNPAVKQLQDRLNGIESSLTAAQQASLQEATAAARTEVDAFASDEKHPYFDEVADDIAILIRAGHKLSDAYDKAVWANPVTRQKELARIQTEADAKRKSKAQEDVEKARRATAANIKGSDTRKAPTEPLGSMDDTLNDTLKTIKGRAH